MHDLLNLSPLVTQAIRPDGKAPNGDLPQGAALRLLRTTALMWKAPSSCTGCGGCEGSVAQQEGAK